MSNNHDKPGGEMPSPNLNGDDFAQDIANEAIEDQSKVSDIPEEPLKTVSESDALLKEASDIPEDDSFNITTEDASLSGDGNGDDSNDNKGTNDTNDQQKQDLTRLTPLGPNDKEAKRWNEEADAIEEYNRMMPGTAKEHLADFRQTMGWESTGDDEAADALTDEQDDKSANHVSEENAHTDPRHQKGADLEEAYEQVVREDENKILLSSHEKVTVPGFDVTYYDTEKKAVVITEEKNFGDEGKPAYVSNISAFNGEHWDNNVNKLIEQVGESDELNDTTKQEIVEAFIDDRIEHELVTSPHTKVTDRTREKYNIDRIKQLDVNDPVPTQVDEQLNKS